MSPVLVMVVCQELPGAIRPESKVPSDAVTVWLKMSSFFHSTTSPAFTFIEGGSKCICLMTMMFCGDFGGVCPAALDTRTAKRARKRRNTTGEGDVAGRFICDIEFSMTGLHGCILKAATAALQRLHKLLCMLHMTLQYRCSTLEGRF